MNYIKDHINEVIKYIKRMLSFIKTKKKVDSIIRSMNSEDIMQLGMNEHDAKKLKYVDILYGILLVKRFIKEVNGLPVAFFDVFQNEDGLNLVVGTRSEFRGKGYGSEITRQALEWIKHLDIKGKITTGIRVDNKPSIKIAEKNGFELDPKSYTEDGKWVLYVYKEPRK